MPPQRTMIVLQVVLDALDIFCPRKQWSDLSTCRW
jgi:hypothetical protein